MCCLTLKCTNHKDGLIGKVVNTFFFLVFNSVVASRNFDLPVWYTQRVVTSSFNSLVLSLECCHTIKFGRLCMNEFSLIACVPCRRVDTIFFHDYFYFIVVHAYHYPLVPAFFSSLWLNRTFARICLTKSITLTLAASCKVLSSDSDSWKKTRAKNRQRRTN